MKVLVTGAEGFIGRNVSDAFMQAGDDVYRGARSEPTDDHHLKLDLLDEAALCKLIADIGPDVIVNCAGIVDVSKDVTQNSVFTANLIRAAAASGRKIGRVVVCGSAGVYGQVEDGELPVKESTPLRATSPYAVSKVEEEKEAINLGLTLKIPVTVARIFNPIGPGMGPRFLVTGTIRQLNELKRGERDALEVGRLDAMRDYVDVRDVASAIIVLAHGDPQESVYNVGSGRSDSNGDLVRLILAKCGVDPLPTIRETSPTPEPRVASQADITKMRALGWEPKYTLEQSVQAVVDEANQA